MLPLNTTRWETAPQSWGAWSWDPDNVRVVEAIPGVENEIPDGSGFAALTMRYEKHQRGGRTYYYKSAIMKSALPSGVSFGRFEARIKGASRWPGVCPAFWAWRRTENYWTEIDFVEMEESDNPRDIDFTSHVFPPTPGVTKELSNSTHTVFDFDPRDDFHIYAMEWNATMLTWWVDDNVVKTLPAKPHFSQGRPMDIALSFGVRPPLRSIPNATGFPTTFYVDWIRAWARTS